MQDDDGRFTAPAASWQMVGMGRAETNGRGSWVATADGRNIQFSATVYMPKGARHITEGDRVAVASRELTEEETADMASLQMAGDVLISSECLRFSEGQLNTRMWI